MENKNIIAALLFFLLFILWNMFGCGCLNRCRISRAVNKLPLATIIMMHTRAHTIDYNQYKVNKSDRHYFRSCVAHRYKNSIQLPINVTIQIQEKKVKDDSEEEKKKRSQSMSQQVSTVPLVESGVKEGVSSGLGALAKPLIESSDPIRNHPHVSSVIE